MTNAIEVYPGYVVDGELIDEAPAGAVKLSIDRPRIVDMPDEEYHADPVAGGSLSSSGARKLLAPSCPAKYAWDLAHPKPWKAEFAFGHAAHRMNLGVGAGIVVVDADDWRTNKAKQDRDGAHAAGKTPLLRDDYQIVKDMAAALQAHPRASALLDPEFGEPEKSLFWIDEDTGVARRARLDWLPTFVSDAGRYVITDYKTAASAARDDFERSAASYGYFLQADWYEDAVRACLGVDAVMVFVVQEKTAPYLVNCIEITAIAREYGHDRNREAIATYERCVRTGVWPGYGDGFDMISLPGWIERQYLEEKKS